MKFFLATLVFLQSFLATLSLAGKDAPPILACKDGKIPNLASQGQVKWGASQTLTNWRSRTSTTPHADGTSTQKAYRSFEPTGVCSMDPKVLAALSRVACDAGGKNITVNSAYRPPWYNAAVGGASKSQHMVCKAIDFSLEGVSPAIVQKIALKLQNEGIVGGVGKYGGFTHIDSGPKRSW